MKINFLESFLSRLKLSFFSIVQETLELQRYLCKKIAHQLNCQGYQNKVFFQKLNKPLILFQVTSIPSAISAELQPEIFSLLCIQLHAPISNFP